LFYLKKIYIIGYKNEDLSKIFTLKTKKNKMRVSFVRYECLSMIDKRPQRVLKVASQEDCKELESGYDEREK
jgi:hypothetical protein